MDLEPGESFAKEAAQPGAERAQDLPALTARAPSIDRQTHAAIAQLAQLEEEIAISEERGRTETAKRTPPPVEAVVAVDQGLERRHRPLGHARRQQMVPAECGAQLRGAIRQLARRKELFDRAGRPLRWQPHGHDPLAFTRSRRRRRHHRLVRRLTWRLL